MHQVNSCCCGCTLKTGTLILTILSLCGGILDIIAKSKTTAEEHVPALYYVYLLVGIITAALALYGTLQEKPSWLIPYLVMNVVGLVILVIAMLIIPIVGPALIIALTPGADEKTKDEIIKAGVGIIVFLEIILAFCLALGYYFTVVVYSFYKQLKTGLLPGPA